MRTDSIFKNILNKSIDIGFILNTSGSFIWVNKAGIKFWGLKSKEVLEKNFPNTLSKQDSLRFQKVFQKIQDENIEETKFHCTHKLKNNIKEPLTWTFIWDKEKEILYGFAEKKKEESVSQNDTNSYLEKLEREIMEKSLEKGTNLSELFTQYIKGLENIFPDMKASLLKIENNTLLHFSSFSLPSSFISAINGQKIGPKGGSCGTAAFLKKRIIVSDISTNPLWEDYKSLALPLGLKACWSQPIFNTKKEVIATFANYYKIKREPSAKELKIFERSASLIGIILENYQNSKTVEKNSIEKKELENLLNKATKLANIGSWDLNLNTKVIYWSPVTRKIHEAPEDFIPTLDMGVSFYREDKRDSIISAVEKAIEKGVQWDLELPIITYKGNERWVRSMGQAEFEDGRAIKLSGSFQDIHKRKIAELELKKTLQDKEEILERIGDAFFAVDKNWIVTYWNRIAEINLQTPKEKILGKNLWDVFSDASEHDSYKYYHQAIETGEVIHFEDFYKPVNRWFEISAYPSKSGLSVYFKDITERKVAEEEIRLSNERFQKVAQATNDAIWDWDILNNTHYKGEGYKTLFGHEVLGIISSVESWTDYIHPDDKEKAVSTLDEAVKDPETFKWKQEYRYRKKNGAYAYVIDRGVIFRDEVGRPVRMVGAMTDITHRVEYQESLKALNQSLENQTKELQISNAELEQFAYVASHDLQEPLRMVTSFLSQLDKKYSDALDEKAQQYIYFAVDGAKRMRQIILDLLDFSRVGKHEEELEKVKIKWLIDDICALYDKVIKEKAAIILYNDLPEIYTYKSPLRQVFQNLISNSLKYSRENTPPKITISAKEKKQHWQFSVKDNGIGIKTEYYDKIFLIFQRLHNKKEYSGTGIGLSIVKKIIERLDGTIWIESQVGEGTTIHFTIKKQK